MSREAFLVSEHLKDPERQLTEMLDFFGIHWERVGPNGLWAPPATRDQRYGVFCPMDLVGRMLKRRTSGSGLPPLLRGADSVFFFGGDDFEANRYLLEFVTQSTAAKLSLVQQSDILCSVSSKATRLCGAFSGLQVPVSLRNQDSTAVFIQSDRHIEPLISTNDGCIFAAVDFEGTRCFIAPCPTFIDISRPVGKGYFDVADYFCSAVPLVMYLRYAFGDVIATSPDNGACLIVDDPVLRPQYGFLDFQKLSALCLEHQVTCNIAFIPWNCRRSQPSVIDLFKRHPERLSLSIHGCDHTAREFGGVSIPSLSGQARLAIRRMGMHEQITGLPYEPLMVFPQGSFSAVAPTVLKHSGFIAAVNTEVSPADQQLRTQIREVWRTAIIKYGNFAIFTRRYPFHGLHNFAFDVMLGKPTLIVTHHSDFQDESRGLLDFIDRLNSLPVPLTWRTLGNVVRRAYQQRLREDGVFQIRMFSSEIIIENAEPVSRDIAVEKSEYAPERIDRVEVAGQKVAFVHDQSYMRFELNIGPRQSLLIRIAYKNLYGEAPAQSSVSGSTKLLVRRCLSEFRDETQARAPWIYSCAQNLRNWVSRAPTAG